MSPKAGKKNGAAQCYSAKKLTGPPDDNPRARPFAWGHLALESESSLAMDASRAQRQDLSRPPRNLFFGAEDLKTTGPDGTADKMFTIRRAQRHKLADQVIDSANLMVSAVRSLRTFDKTGNAGLALDNIEDVLTDLQKLVRNLVTEVESSEERWLETNVTGPALAGGQPDPEPDPENDPPSGAAQITPLVMARTVESTITAALDQLESRRARA